VVQAAIIVYAAFAALTQLGMAVELTAPTFLIVLGGVALVAAIAFGWGPATWPRTSSSGPTTGAARAGSA